MRIGLVALLLFALVGLGGVVAWSRSHAALAADPSVAKFHEQAESLILGLQQYREFLGQFPSGSNADITKSINGQGDKRVLILVGRKGEISGKGEIVDPWGTPLQIYFSHDGVLLRSAGPNRVFENARTDSDDLYRTTN